MATGAASLQHQLVVTPVQLLEWIFCGLVPLALVYALVTRFARTPVALSPVAVLLVLATEIAFTVLVPPRSGSSWYRPMFPDFAAGFIIGGSTIAAAKPFLSLRSVRIIVSLMFCVWTIGVVVTDALWYSEGTQRGTGPLWNYPVLSTIFEGVAVFLLNGGGLACFCPLFNIWATSVPIAAYLTLLLTAILIWFFWRNQPERLAMFSMACSLALLTIKLVEWAPFMAD